MKKNLFKKLLSIVLVMVMLVTCMGAYSGGIYTKKQEIIEQDFTVEKEEIVHKIIAKYGPVNVTEQRHDTGIIFSVEYDRVNASLNESKNLDEITMFKYSTTYSLFEYNYDEMETHEIFDASLQLNYSCKEVFAEDGLKIRNYKLNSVSGTFYNKSLNAVDNIRMQAFAIGGEYIEGGSWVFRASEQTENISVTLNGTGLERTFNIDTNFIHYHGNLNLGSIYADFLVSAHNYYGHQVLENYAMSIILPINH